MLGFLIVFFVLWIVVGPLLTFLHELGHAGAALVFTDDWVRIEMGSQGLVASMTLGRLALQLRFGTGFVGYFWYGGSPAGTWQRIAIQAAGPIVSLLIAIVSYGFIFSLESPPDVVRTVLFWTGNGALIQFLVTAIPIRYPGWWYGYAGMASDGERIRRALRQRHRARGETTS